MTPPPQSPPAAAPDAHRGAPSGHPAAVGGGEALRPSRRWSVLRAITVLIAFVSMFSAFVHRDSRGDLVELTGYLRTRVVEAQLADFTEGSSEATARAHAALSVHLVRVGDALQQQGSDDVVERHRRLAAQWAAADQASSAQNIAPSAERRALYADLLSQANELTRAVAADVDQREAYNRRLQWLSALAFLLCAATWLWQLRLLHRRSTQSAQRVLARINEELGRDGAQAHPRHITEQLDDVDEQTGRELRQLVASIEGILGESEQRWRVRAELSSDYYWETDAQHRFTYVTSGFEDKFFKPADMIGRTRWELAPASLSPAQWEQHRRQLDTHLPFRRLELCKTHPDGTQVWASVAGEPRFDAQGRFLGYQGVGRDITERKRREQQLQRYNTELEQQVRQRTQALTLAYSDMEAFVRNVAHDLRTPLSQVRSLIGLARAQTVAAPPGRTNFIGLAEQQADITLEMLEALLELARASSTPVQLVPVHLRSLAESCAATVQRPDGAAPIEWHFACEHTVMADSSLLRLALTNLMSNAVKFSAGVDLARVAVLSSIQPDGAIEVHVVDNGVGFDDSQASRLFKPFSRLHHGAEFTGTGIGLSVVSKVMERLGGGVGAESTPGLGARFILRLPATALAAETPRIMHRPATAAATYSMRA
jgi:PAS domain S-box-containing protein